MSPLADIRSSRHNRLTVLFALLALLFATTAYVAHGFKHDLPLSQHSTAQCDLCLHFSGTAGTPDHPDTGGKPPLGAFVPATSESLPLATHEHPTNRLPRAPPALT